MILVDVLHGRNASNPISRDDRLISIDVAGQNGVLDAKNTGDQDADVISTLDPEISRQQSLIWCREAWDLKAVEMCIRGSLLGSVPARLHARDGVAPVSQVGASSSRSLLTYLSAL